MLRIDIWRCKQDEIQLDALGLQNVKLWLESDNMYTVLMQGLPPQEGKSHTSLVRAGPAPMHYFMLYYRVELVLCSKQINLVAR